MKYKLLAAVASVAFIATGVAAQAQDTQKQEQRPAAERSEQKAPAKAMEQREAPKAAEAPRNEAPKAAQTERREEKSRAAQSEGDQGTMRKEPMKPAEAQQPKRMAEPSAKDATPAERTGANDKDRTAPRTAERHEDRGAARVVGKVNISSEHAARVGEVLRRDGRPETVNIDIQVGARVPETVVIRPLPAEVIALVPEYRGYNYFIDANDEIVFVSPETHEIVGAIDYEGRAASESSTTVAGARPCPVEN